jgi:hypothetical protein
LENLGGGHAGLGLAWGLTQMYFRLSPQQLAALRAGEELRFSQGTSRPELHSWDQPLPSEVARGVLQSLRGLRLRKTKDGYGQADDDDPHGLPLSAIPEAHALVSLKLKQTELGQFGLDGFTGYDVPGAWHVKDRGPYAVGVSPKTVQPENSVVNAKFARDPALRSRVSVQPQPRVPAQRADNLAASAGPRLGQETGTDNEQREPKVTSADVLEALHHATGMPIIADFYTRLYKPDAVTFQSRPLFDILNGLGDAMHLRWNKDASTREAGASWLQFRSTTYYHDRLKEVPNRLLTRWSAARREHGVLRLEELVEIAQLPDAPLNASSMAEGARECWDLAEWDLACDSVVRANLRFLAQLTPAQRQEMQSPSGLPITRMAPAQQQAFLNRRVVLQPDLHSLEELSGARLRVDYTQPGWFIWQPPQNETYRWAVRSTPGREGKWLSVPAVRERTQEAALQALRQVDPLIRTAVRATTLAEVSRAVVPLTMTLPPEEEAIVPAQLNLALIYIPETARERLAYWARDEEGYSEQN